MSDGHGQVTLTEDRGRRDRVNAEKTIWHAVFFVEERSGVVSKPGVYFLLFKCIYWMSFFVYFSLFSKTRVLDSLLCLSNLQGFGERTHTADFFSQEVDEL